MFNLFGKRKAKCPVTHEDGIWVENNLLWLDKRILNVAKQPTFLPTKNYFPYEFTGKEEDAEFVLETVCDMIGAARDNIRLNFFSTKTHYFGFGMGTQIERESEDDLAGGMYVFDDGRHEIAIEMGQLKDPVSLIAVIAHELCHYTLIGMHEIGYSDDTENEYLTDLLAIAYGFGVFLGNSQSYHKATNLGDGFTQTSIGKQGYLPRQVIAYAMALIQLHKNKTAVIPDWSDMMNTELKKYFKKSLSFVDENKQVIIDRGNPDNLFVWK